jgi:hypothetical protein
MADPSLYDNTGGNMKKSPSGKAKATPKAATQTTPKTRSASRANTPAKWSVMVYLAGDNNLDGAGVTDLMEMKKVGSNSDVSIVAQFDRAGGKGTTKRFFLRQGTSLAADAVADLGETDTGDPAVLQDFLTWGIQTYPADHYLVVIWNHGAGWDDSNLYAGGYFSGETPPIVHKGQTIDAKGSVAKSTPDKRIVRRRTSAPAPVPLAQARAAIRHGQRALFSTSVRQMVQSRAIAFDDQAKDYLDNAELKRVLTNVKKVIKRNIDIVGFDACLMSMLEVSYQIKGAADFTVGSQEEEPNNGWSYDRLLTALTSKPTMAPADVARGSVRTYLASYGNGDGVTFAATDLAQVTTVRTAVNHLGTALAAALGTPSAKAALVSVRARVQEYSAPYDDYVDLVDLCDGLTAVMGRADVTSACMAVKTAMGKMVLASGAKGANVARSHGSSIYFPKKQVCRLYASLDFAKKSAWAKFIQAYCAGVNAKSWG